MISAKLSARGLKPVSILCANKPHGTRLRYLSGCKCDLCRRANTDYQLSRMKAIKEGDWNGIISAKKARAHLIYLSKYGIVRRAVADATVLSETILFNIRAEKQTHIRARTERLILSVTFGQAANYAHTDAAPSWKLINILLKKGYTKTQIAHGIGCEWHALQIGKVRVTILNAYKVRRLYEKCASKGFTDAKHFKAPEVLPQNTYRSKSGALVHRLPG
jgi:hypothetical protein